MTNFSKNEAKARGGVARAEALTPERRKEIAQTAALSRWGASTRPRKAPVVRMLKGVPSLKRLTLTSEDESDGPGTKTTVIHEHGQVLRTFAGLCPSVDERVQSYLMALQDLGIALEVDYRAIPAVMRRLTT